MNYKEDPIFCSEYKKAYIDGIKKIIDQRQKQAECIRDAYFKDVFQDQEKYRQDFKSMLGWPLVDHESVGLPEVTTEKLSQEDGYCICRMQFEILPGLKLTGLLFKANGEEKRPMVIVQHGGLGTPELIAGFYGTTSNYNDMLHRVRAQGVDVFAPQLLLWGDQYQVEYDRKALDNRLKRVGSSLTAIELYGLIRILDYFEAQPEVSSFGMVGLSYGGAYTFYAAAVDTRIRSAISCAYFNKRDAYPWGDWIWFRSAEKMDDAEIACLIYPRKLCIEIADQDELFDYQFGVESFEKLKRLCKDVEMDWVDFIVFGGTHEFHKDDAPIQRLAHDLKNIIS